MNDHEYELIGESIWDTYQSMAYILMEAPLSREAKIHRKRMEKHEAEAVKAGIQRGTKARPGTDFWPPNRIGDKTTDEPTSQEQDAAAKQLGSEERLLTRLEKRGKRRDRSVVDVNYTGRGVRHHSDPEREEEGELWKNLRYGGTKRKLDHHTQFLRKYVYTAQRGRIDRKIKRGKARMASLRRDRKGGQEEQ